MNLDQNNLLITADHMHIRNSAYPELDGTAGVLCFAASLVSQNKIISYCEFHLYLIGCHISVCYDMTSFLGEEEKVLGTITNSI